MLEGDETFVVASETAYRLCLAPISWKDLSPHSIPSFSAVWCPDQSFSSYYCCLRNGYVYYLDTTSSHDCTIFNPEMTPPSYIYEVLFQSYTSEGHKSTDPPRRISLHWDKMRLIPGRPGEVLFLLGITQSLYYSAFPGTSSPLTSPIYPPTSGYTFGTPVIELVNHNGRITSLEVSSCGHMLATGDEHGYVKLMMISRPGSLKHTIQRSPHELGDKINFECFEEEVRVNVLRAHFGPVFSMCWINITEDYKQSKAYERSMSSPDNRTPWMYTDGEKVYYYLVTGSNDRFVRIWSVMWSRVGIEVVPFVQYDVISAPILSLSSFTLTKPAIRSSFTRRTSSAALPSSFEHLIGASTETGIIYLWKLGSSSDKPESNNLVSMIHSSKFPLVNLTITIVPEKDTPSIVVVASDIQGSVRIHLSTLSGTTDQSSSAKGHPGSERKESLLFILQGQASFNSPIISCKFLERMHRTELSVFLVSGEMKLYPILDLLQTSRRAKEAEVVDDVPEDNFSDISEQNPSNSKPTAIVQTLEVSKSNVTDSTPLDDEYPAPPPTPIAPPTLSSYLSSPPQSPKASPTPLKLNAPGGTKKSPSKPQGPTNESPKKFAPTKASPKQSADVMQKALPETTTQSEFSSPSLHTAKVCILSLSSSSPSHQALGSYLQAQPVIEVDNVSISTIETTTTDRHNRANETVNLPSRQRVYQSPFPDFTESEIERRMPQKTILRPQVCPAYSTPPFPDPWQIDKKWKSKLQSAMPTEEGLKLMTPKDPVIHLNYVSKSPTDPTSTDSLRCLPLQDSPLPSHVYSCEVNLNQIFGEISAAKSWEEFQRQGEDSSFILTDEGLSDRSPYILPIIQRQGFFQFV